MACAALTFFVQPSLQSLFEGCVHTFARTPRLIQWSDWVQDVCQGMLSWQQSIHHRLKRSDVKGAGCPVDTRSARTEAKRRPVRWARSARAALDISDANNHDIRTGSFAAGPMNPYGPGLIPPAWPPFLSLQKLFHFLCKFFRLVILPIQFQVVDGI